MRPTPPPTARREDLARAWARAASLTSYVPRPAEQIESLLLDLVDQLLASLAEDEFSPTAAMDVGRRLVAEGFVEPSTLHGTVEVLTEGLLGDVEATPDTEFAHRTVAMLGAMSAGYAAGLRTYSLDQQEEVNHALLVAVARSEHDLRSIQNRFREVFATSAAGIAISDLDGVCVEANPALAEILACQQDELIGTSLREFFVEDSAAVYRKALSGQDRRVHARRKLRKANDEDAWGLVAVSLLRDGADEPAFFVTMIQDISEIQLLQGRLEYQLLHDALTALPNRRHFESRLEGVLGGAAPGTTVTLCCVNLDAFAVVNNTYGHVVGDQLLQTVARRLETAVADLHGLVARTGGDEFAVLVEDPPELTELLDTITAELAEPQFIDGNGITVSPSIGAVSVPASAMSPAELFRAASSALTKARRSGRRQWAPYDRQADALARASDDAATRLASAWEDGELVIDFQPVVRLGGSETRPIAARAVLTAPGLPNHRACVELAERTGLAVLLGPSILLAMCAWQAANGGPVHVQLTRTQSADADLIQSVNRAIETHGVAPESLVIALDTAAVRDDLGDARDNLDVLAEIGVGTGLCEFRGGPRELAMMAGTAVSAVTLSGPLTTDTVLRKETEHLVAAITDRGRECTVLDIASKEEASWWAAAGASTAQGGIFEASLLGR